MGGEASGILETQSCVEPKRQSQPRPHSEQGRVESHRLLPGAQPLACAHPLPFYLPDSPEQSSVGKGGSEDPRFQVLLFPSSINSF